MIELTEHQQKVLAAFDKKNEDISISLLFMRVYGHYEWRKKGMTVRKMQQKLAPTFKVLNNKLENMEIVTGHLKNTYRLDVHTDEE